MTKLIKELFEFARPFLHEALRGWLMPWIIGVGLVGGLIGFVAGLCVGLLF